MMLLTRLFKLKSFCYNICCFSTVLSCGNQRTYISDKYTKNIDPWDNPDPCFSPSMLCVPPKCTFWAIIRSAPSFKCWDIKVWSLAGFSIWDDCPLIWPLNWPRLLFSGPQVMRLGAMDVLSYHACVRLHLSNAEILRLTIWLKFVPWSAFANLTHPKMRGFWESSPMVEVYWWNPIKMHPCPNVSIGEQYNEGGTRSAGCVLFREHWKKSLLVDNFI